MKWMLVVVALGACGACGGSRQPPAQDQVIASSTPTPPPDAAVDAPWTEQYLAKLTEFRDTVCKCTDQACVNRATQDMSTWARGWASDPNVPARLGDADAQRAEEVTTETVNCRNRLMKPAASP
jgi:hypothetical protein